MNVYVSPGHKVKYISICSGKFISMSCGQKNVPTFESYYTIYKSIGVSKYIIISYKSIFKNFIKI